MQRIGGHEGPQPAVAIGRRRRRALRRGIGAAAGATAATPESTVSPSTPVTMNAARQPLRTAIHVASSGASIMPRLHCGLIHGMCPWRARRA